MQREQWCLCLPEFKDTSGRLWQSLLFDASSMCICQMQTCGKCSLFSLAEEVRNKELPLSPFGKRGLEARAQPTLLAVSDRSCPVPLVPVGSLSSRWDKHLCICILELTEEFIHLKTNPGRKNTPTTEFLFQPHQVPDFGLQAAWRGGTEQPGQRECSAGILDGITRCDLKKTMWVSRNHRCLCLM